MSNLQCINLEIAMQNVNQDEELWKDMLMVYQTNLPDMLVSLKNRCDNKQYKEYIVEVHGLKSNAALLGATELSEHARLCEFAGKDGNYDYIHQHTEELIEEFHQLLDEINGLLA